MHADYLYNYLADLLPSLFRSASLSPAPRRRPIKQSEAMSPVEPSSAPKTDDEAHLALAITEAHTGVTLGEGGPFGAVITRNGVIVARGHNRVLKTNDPTAHAEVVAIRDACARLGTWSLDDCVLYSSCEPCPMCFSAIHWAKVPKVFFAASADDAAAVGFDDRFLYDALRGKEGEKKCDLVCVDVDGKMGPFEEFQRKVKDGSSQVY